MKAKIVFAILYAMFCLWAILVSLAVHGAEVEGPHCHILDPDGGIVSTSLGDCPASPPPDPDPDPEPGPCPFTDWRSNPDLDLDINPLDGVVDSHNRACTSQLYSDCAWYKEMEVRPQVEGQIFGYAVNTGPYPSFSVNYRVWINAQPGAQFAGITINADKVCLSNVPRSAITLMSGAENIYLDGVRID